MNRTDKRIISNQEYDWRVAYQCQGGGQFAFVAAAVGFAWFVNVVSQRELLGRPGYNLQAKNEISRLSLCLAKVKLHS